MTRNTKIIFILALASFLHSACQTHEEDKKIELYSSEFELLNQELNPNHEIVENGIYYLIFSNSCEQCVASNIFMLEELSTTSKNFIPIFLGTSDKINVRSIYDDVIKSKFNKSMLLESFSIGRYKLDVTKPLLLHYQGGKLVYIKNYSDLQLNEAKEYIVSNLK